METARRPTQDEKLREQLIDLAALAEQLAPLCGSTQDLVSILSLAVENEGQFNLLKVVCFKQK